MDGRLFLIAALVGSLLACDPPSTRTTYDLYLSTMGTTGVVRVVTDDPADTIGLLRRIDSLLVVVNDEMSTYIPTSTISRFNASDADTFSIQGTDHIGSVVVLSAQLYEASEGAFDPTVMPLVRYWGFAGGEPPVRVDSAAVDSLRARVGMDRLSLVGNGDHLALRRAADGVELDLSAIAKGHGVDVVSDLLTARGLTDHMVEIGGEVRCSGRTDRGTVWTIGIERPDEDERGLYAAIPLDGLAMATSGNYRNVRTTQDGRTVWHTIDPTTGFPGERDVLSATVIARGCAMADGLATACMVLGSEGCLELLEGEDAEGFLILGDDAGGYTTRTTSGFPDVRILDDGS